MPAGTQRCLPAQGRRAASGGQEYKNIKPARYITGRAGAGLAWFRQTTGAPGHRAGLTKPRVDNQE
ncbi:hypothetical protein CBM2586_A11141 [Cupriavidus phytorum]|uniref:Uncharacterized protein n=1 Tax=Cupriavidus taiwanensis TaxID=164546 RepID=A0A375BCW4_9BURK|nr:hypothetical protein CBM2586_A11141 [Cupriavidus taiwanensis]